MLLRPGANHSEDAGSSIELLQEKLIVEQFVPPNVGPQSFDAGFLGQPKRRQWSGL